MDVCWKCPECMENNYISIKDILSIGEENCFYVRYCENGCTRRYINIDIKLTIEEIE